MTTTRHYRWTIMFLFVVVVVELFLLILLEVLL